MSSAVDLPHSQQADTSPTGVIDETETLAFPQDGIQPQVFHMFIHACGGRDMLQNLSTSEVCQKYLLPLTNSTAQESYTEQLRREKPATVGKATVFISHAWRFDFLSLVDVLLARYTDQLDGDVYLWFDLFSNNQHRASLLPFEWWCGTFKSAIRDIHHTVLVLEPWSDPIPFTRAWCLWEIFCTIETESQLDICLTSGNEARFVESVLHDSGAFFDMLSTIDVRNSDAWNPCDKERIFEVVRKTVGFEAINTIILKQMRLWVLEVLRSSIINDQMAAVDVFDKQICLASLLRKQGMFAESLSLNSNCLECATASYGADDPKTLTAMNSLGMLYKVMGKRQQALDLYETCLDLRRAVLGALHVDTLHSVNNLAIVYKAMGKYDVALKLFEECLLQRRALLGDTHSSTLASLNNLANLYKATGDIEQAVALYEECYNLKRTSVGVAHPDTLNSMNNLAIGYKAVDRDHAALQLYLHCWALRKEKLGPSHPDSLVSMNNIARMYQTMERFEEAVQMFEECWQCRSEKFGSHQRASLTSMGNLASCYKHMGRFEEALELTQRCFDQRLEQFGKYDSDTLSSLHDWAHLLSLLDRDTEALQKFETCVSLRMTASGDLHPYTLSSQVHLGKQLQKLNRLDEAVVVLEAVYTKRIMQLGAEHTDTISTMSSLAALLREVGEYTRAEELYVGCLENRTETKGVHHMLSRGAMCGLALVYAGKGEGEAGLDRLHSYLLLAEEAISTQRRVQRGVQRNDKDADLAVRHTATTSLTEEEAASQSSMTHIAGTATITTIREATTSVGHSFGKQHTVVAVADEECIATTNIVIACIYFLQGKSQEADLLFCKSIKKLVEMKGPHSLIVRGEIKAYARISGQEYQAVASSIS